MTGQPLGLGLVGAGAFGQFCLEAFAAMPEVNIVAVADVDWERAQLLAAHHGAQASPSLEAMLENPSLQIVALNTPPYLHAEQGLQVLRAGKHLFCEKPLALTYEDGLRLIQAAETNRVLLTVDYVMRHNPYYAMAASLTRAGVFGSLRHMDLANHAAGLDLPAHHWFWDVSKSGGIWIEHGVHFFDAFAWVSGQKGKVTTSSALTRSDGHVDRVEALAQYGGTLAHFYHAFDQSSNTEQTTVKLTYERAYITLCEWIPTSLQVATTEPLENFRSQLPGDVTTKYVGSQLRVTTRAPEGKTSLYRRCIQSGLLNLIRAIQNPDTPLAVTGVDALESLRLALAATFPSLL